MDYVFFPPNYISLSVIQLSPIATRPTATAPIDTLIVPRTNSVEFKPFILCRFNEFCRNVSKEEYILSTDKNFILRGKV